MCVCGVFVVLVGFEQTMDKPWELLKMCVWLCTLSCVRWGQNVLGMDGEERKIWLVILDDNIETCHCVGNRDRVVGGRIIKCLKWGGRKCGCVVLLLCCCRCE